MTAVDKQDKLLKQYEAMLRYEREAWLAGFRQIAGVDEAGRGPLAGPVAAAACILDPDKPVLGLNDSKKLSEKKRETLYSQILSQAVCWHVVLIDADHIDRQNILNATRQAMCQAVA